MILCGLGEWLNHNDEVAGGNAWKNGGGTPMQRDHVEGFVELLEEGSWLIRGLSISRKGTGGINVVPEGRWWKVSKRYVESVKHSCWSTIPEGGKVTKNHAKGGST